MQFVTTAVGAAAGIPQGDLQGSLSNLQTIVRIVTPLLRGSVYNLGLRVGRPSLIYYVSAASGLVQMWLVRALLDAPDDEPL